MDRFLRALATVISVVVLASALANAELVINITQAGANVNVTATGNLDLTGATFGFSTGYDTGIIPGGDNWYVAGGATPTVDLYELTGLDLPFGTDTSFHTSNTTSGDAFLIWGDGGQTPYVGVPAGYLSGSPISGDLVLPGQTIAGLTLIPGTYTFTIPNDTIVLEISGTNVPEPSSLAMMLNSVAVFALAGYRRRRPHERSR